MYGIAFGFGLVAVFGSSTIAPVVESTKIGLPVLSRRLRVTPSIAGSPVSWTPSPLRSYHT